MSTDTEPSPRFESAAAYLANASLPNVSTTLKLELYGLFKVVTASTTPQTSRPSIFDMTGRAKWDAWKAAGQNYPNSERAEAKYIEIASQLGWSEGQPISEEEPRQTDGKSSDRSGSGGLGLSVSSMGLGPNQNDGSVHGLAIANDAKGLIAYLEANPQTDLNERDEYGYSALHLAADRGNIDAVSVLLNSGADASLQDSDGLQAYELAEVGGHKDIVAKLLEHTTTKNT